jgi:hypothetical protein
MTGITVGITVGGDYGGDYGDRITEDSRILREILRFFRHTVPKQWKRFCDRISDNFRVT